MNNQTSPRPPRVALSDWRERVPPPGVRGISSDPILAKEGLTIVVVRLEPGAEVPLHCHEHSDEIFDVCEGSGEILIDERWVPLEAGSTALVEAGALHALRNRGSGTFVIRETVRDRVYARAAIAAALQKRWRKLRSPRQPAPASPFFQPEL